MREQLFAVIEEEMGIRPTEDMTFADLGMDSLDFMCLIQEIRLKVGPITRQQAQSCLSVSDLIAVLECQ